MDLRWQSQGACAASADDTFFPAERLRSRIDTWSTRAAKQQCNQECTVRETCLKFALEEGIDFGIWGGMTTRERNKLKKQLRKPPLAAEA